MPRSPCFCDVTIADAGAYFGVIVSLLLRPFIQSLELQSGIFYLSRVNFQWQHFLRRLLVQDISLAPNRQGARSRVRHVSR